MKTMKHLIFIALFAFSLPVDAQKGWEAGSQNTESLEHEKTAINALIENYISSINQADIALAETFWLTNDKVSFINPKGHIKGWAEIKNKVYKMFDARFSSRDLSVYNKAISLYGDMAVVEFYWTFNATFSGDNPTAIETKGRETQVLKKFGDEWKLVHVHYSNMPVSGEREGF